MATSFGAPSASPITLEECISRLDKIIRPDVPQSAMDGVEILAALSANRSFLADFVLAELGRSASAYQAGNNYTDITINLHFSSNYHLRANVWTASQSFNGSTEVVDRLHAYGLAHNHNFQFLTVGYFGPGYRTTIAEFDPKRITGNPIGQKAHLRDFREITLRESEMIYFEAHSDAHVQHPCPELSVSINLMPKQSGVHLTEQYEFDFASDRITDYVRGQVSHRVELIKMLGLLGGPDYQDEFLELAQSFPCPRTRLACMKQLARHMAATDLKYLVGRDASAMVRQAMEASPTYEV